MADRSSNGEYNKYQHDDDVDTKPRLSLEKDDKDSQVDKAGEYVRELLQEKLELDTQKWPNALRLIDQEIQKTQAIGKPLRDQKYVDIYREKPIRVAVKVLVPVREHPKKNEESDPLFCDKLSPLGESSPDNQFSNIIIEAPEQPQHSSSTIGFSHMNRPSLQYNLPLLEFLEGCSKGIEILRSYDINNNTLLWRMSKELVHLVIDREKDEVLRHLKRGEVLESWEVPKARLIYLAHEIAATFEGQSATSYYHPFCVENGTRISATGKLLDHISYVKRLMRIDGILKDSKERRRIRQAADISEQPTSKIESLNNDLEYVKNHSEPFEEVKNAFKRTSELRKQLLQVQNVSLFDYMLSVKSLRHNLQGQELINLDFVCRYKNHHSKLKEKWPKIREFFISLLKSGKSVTADDAPYVSILPKLEIEQQDVLLYYLLHYITTTSRWNRKRKYEESPENGGVDAKKLSSDDKRNSYLLHIKDAAELEMTLARVRSNTQAQKIKPQPLIVIVGPLLSIQHIYVIVDDIRYTVTTMLDAIDLNFKIFFVFDCLYPDYSMPMWQFIQIVIYEIRKPGERLSVQHRDLEGEIKRLIR